MQEFGISFTPLAAELPLFNIESFFGTDIAHLLSNNVPLKFFDLWTDMGLKPTIRVAGSLLAAQQHNFPSSFGTFPRDPGLFANTQYRLFELALWVSFFSLPTLRDAGLQEVSFWDTVWTRKERFSDPSLRSPPQSHPHIFEHWALFVRIFQLVSSTKPLSKADLEEIRDLAEKFNTLHEVYYTEMQLAKVSTFPLCIHRLLHLHRIYELLGNPHHYSQLPLERRIGILKTGATSKPNPFASMVHRVSPGYTPLLIHRAVY